MDIIAQVVLVIDVVCSAILGVSTSGSNFVLSTLLLLLYIAFQKADGTLSHSHENIMKQIPATIGGALSKFRLSFKTVPYAICTCHCTYAPTYPPGSKTPIYPNHCTNFPTPEQRCDNPIVSEAGTPYKTFIYHDFKGYLTSLLTRRDIESMMDSACDELYNSLSSPPPHAIKNPFEAQFLREFQGPEPERLFIDHGHEGHYIFALHVNFFNPEGMSVRGPSSSSGIISMACLNLPSDIRYKPENMYLAGIIPGPKQPSLENLNHYLRPLVDDMVASWNQGIHFSRTAIYPNGQVTQSAIALAVCDLPAAHHLSALAGIGSHFLCSMCNCYHKSNFGRTNFADWTPRDKDKLHHYAERWKDASTSSEHETIFKEHGVRYSELWCLPYWDPAWQLVVDSMHCILEGLFQHHIRHLLGLTMEKPPAAQSVVAFHFDFARVPSDAAAECSMTKKEVTQVSTIHALLTTQVPNLEGSDSIDSFMTSLKESLCHKNAWSLKFVCDSLGCTPAKHGKILKVEYAEALVDWVCLS